jgi:surface antigen
MSVRILAPDLTKLPRNGIFGTVNSIQVYSNGYNYDYHEKDRSDTYGIDLGSKWQCVEWIRRFYYLAYGKRIGINTTYAKEFYLKCLNWGMKAYPNGSSDNIRTGDIIVFAATPKNEAGHVSLVTKVTPGYIEVAQQNVYGFAHLNYRINRTGNTLLKDTMGNTAIGWIR